MTYVHRSGRTGRAGKHGVSALLYSLNESKNVQNIKMNENVPFKHRSFPGEEELHAASVTRVLEQLHDVPFDEYKHLLPKAEDMITEHKNEPLATP